MMIQGDTNEYFPKFKFTPNGVIENCAGLRVHPNSKSKHDRP